MKIALPDDFLATLKNKHLLLDTGIFIDSTKNSSEFTQLFNSLKDNDTTLVTIHPVLIEFLRGASTQEIVNEKKAAIESIIETYLPLTDEIFTYTEKLFNEYKGESKDLSITDLLLGSCLLKYRANLYLLTRDIADFPTNIFNLETHFNLIHRKAIHSYGVYSYTKK